MRDFRKLQIWTSSIEQVVSTYTLTKEFPSEEKFGLCSQLQRAAVSIPSNIAEGCSRNSNLEFKRFLEISMGSAFELETQLIIANKLNYVSNEKLEKELITINELQRKINSLITKVKSDQL